VAPPRPLGAALAFLAGAAMAGLLAAGLPCRSCPPPAAAARAELIAHHLRLDGNLAPGALLFFGSSSIQGLAVGDVAERAVNFGVGGETISLMAERLPRYRSLASARGAVLAVGYNDLASGEPEAALGRYAALLDALPPDLPLILSGVQPGLRQPARERATRFNAGLATICAGRPRCSFLDLAAALVSGEHYEADGIHLSPAGYTVWKRQLAEMLKRAGLAR